MTQLLLNDRKYKTCWTATLASLLMLSDEEDIYSNWAYRKVQPMLWILNFLLLLIGYFTNDKFHWFYLNFSVGASGAFKRPCSIQTNHVLCLRWLRVLFLVAGEQLYIYLCPSVSLSVAITQHRLGLGSWNLAWRMLVAVSLGLFFIFSNFQFFDPKMTPKQWIFNQNSWYAYQWP